MKATLLLAAALWTNALHAQAPAAQPKADVWARATYVALIATQAGDLATTEIALQRGAHERNPLMVHAAARYTLKPALAAFELWQLRKAVKEGGSDRKASLWIVTGLNVFYGWVIWHNVGVIRQLR